MHAVQDPAAVVFLFLLLDHLLAEWVVRTGVVDAGRSGFLQCVFQDEPFLLLLAALDRRYFESVLHQLILEHYFGEFGVAVAALYLQRNRVLVVVKILLRRVQVLQLRVPVEAAQKLSPPLYDLEGLAVHHNHPRVFAAGQLVHHFEPAFRTALNFFQSGLIEERSEDG